MNKFVKSLSALVFCTALFCLSSTANALMIVQMGNPVETESWEVTYGFTGLFMGAFDTIEAFVVKESDGSIGKGGPFEAPGLTFTDARWSGTLVNPTYALATGASVTGVTLTVHFDGDLDPVLDGGTPTAAHVPKPVTFDFLFYSGGVDGTLLSSLRFSYDGKTFAMADISAVPSGDQGYDRVDPPAPADPVPDTGSTLALLGMGMAGLGGLRRKLRLS